MESAAWATWQLQAGLGRSCFSGGLERLQELRGISPCPSGSWGLFWPQRHRARRLDCKGAGVEACSSLEWVMEGRSNAFGVAPQALWVGVKEGGLGTAP